MYSFFILSTLILKNVLVSKRYYHKKITSLFSSYFVCLLKTWLAKIWALIFIQRLFTMSASFGFHCPPLLTFKTDRLAQRVGSRENDVIYSLLYTQNASLKVWKPETFVLHVNSAANTRIAFLNYWVFDIIFSSIQLSQDFKVSQWQTIK